VDIRQSPKTDVLVKLFFSGPTLISQSYRERMLAAPTRNAINAGWRYAHHPSYSPSSPVSTTMGDRFEGIPSWHFNQPPGQLSLAIPPWVEATSTGDNLGHRLLRKIGT